MIELNLFDEEQPIPVVETRVEFWISDGFGETIFGKGIALPWVEGQASDITLIRFAAKNCHLATKHGVVSEQMTVEQVVLFLRTDMHLQYLEGFEVALQKHEFEVLA